MYSYARFAWNDACSIADLLTRERLDISAAYSLFCAMDGDHLRRIEQACGSMIEDFIGRAESQRPSVVRKVVKAAGKEAGSVFVVLSVIGLMRVNELLTLRDQYRDALAPGSGNRATCAAVYSFQQEVAELSKFEWPEDVLETISNGYEYETRDLPDWDEVRREKRATGADAERVTRTLEAMVVASAQQATEAAEVAKQPLIAINAIASPSFSIDGELRVVRGKSGKDLFRSVLMPNGADEVWVSFTSCKPSSDELIKILSLVTPSANNVVLGLPSSLKDLIDPLEKALGNRYRRIESLGPAHSRLPAAHWAEEFLASMEVELALVGEPNLTLPELASLHEEAGGAWMKLDFANPKGDRDMQIARREELETICRKVLVERGRWKGPPPSFPSHLLPGGSAGIFGDLERARREIAKLQRYVDDGRATELGASLHAIASGVHGWISAPTTPGCTEALGDLIVRFALGRKPDRTYQSPTQHLLSEMLPYGSPLMDLADMAVLRRLGRPVPIAWVPELAEGYGAPPTTVAAAFWCEVSCKKGALLGYSGTPSRGTLRNAPDGVTIEVHPHFKTFQPGPVTTKESWAKRFGHIHAAIEQFYSSVARGRDRSVRTSDWFTPNPTEGRRYAQVVMRASSADQIDAARANWSALARELNVHLQEVLDSAHVGAHASFSKSLESFGSPYAYAGGSRLTLLLGETWTETAPEPKPAE